MKKLKEIVVKNRIYIIISLLFLISISIGFITDDDFIKKILTGVAGLNALSFFLVFGFDQAKSAIAFTYDKKKLAYDISINSQFAYDIHTEYLDFCKQYVEMLFEIFQKMFRDGGSEKCLDYSHDLNRLRDKYTLIIPEKVHKELYDFEFALRYLGAEYGLQKNLLHDVNGDEMRKISIKKTHKLFMQLMDVNNSDDDKKIRNKEEIVSYIRETIGINKLNLLKEEILM